MGLNGSGVRKQSSGGVYSGPRLADIEKNVQAAQAHSIVSKGSGSEEEGTSMLTWKRKEREWLKSSKEEASEMKGGPRIIEGGAETLAEKLKKG